MHIIEFKEKTMMKKIVSALVMAGSAIALFPVAPALADTPLFSENFNSASGSPFLNLNSDNYSEKWNLTYYYQNPLSAGWTFNSPALLAVNGNNSAERAILLNEPGADATTTTSIGGFVVGQLYSLTFEHWGDNRPTPANSVGYKFETFLDATLLGNVSRAYPAPGPGATASFDFIATKTSYFLKFLDITTSGQSSAIIDNITISAVPEPDTFAMLLAGLGLMGFVARRRKQYPA
jgi:hypothetical protein